MLPMVRTAKQDVIVFPKFLTRELAAIVVNRLYLEISGGASYLSQMIPDGELDEGFHVSISVPCRWNGIPARAMLYERSFGDVSGKWRYPYHAIAQSKNRQMAEEQSDGASISPHLLFPGDTPYWGGIEVERVIVTCSGFKEPADREASCWVANKFIALAREAWEASDDKKNEVNFLT